MNKKKVLVFDCETCALSDAELALVQPEFKPPANYRDPEKIAAHIEEQRSAWKERAALSAVTGRVAAVGIAAGGAVTIDLGDDESGLLRNFWSVWDAQMSVGGKPARFVGFNIKRFDLPFMVRRSWRLGVRVPSNLYSGRYWSDWFIDLMEVWQMGSREDSISLSTLAKYLGAGEKLGSGADFSRLTKPQRELYLRRDLELTKACAERLL